MTLTVTRVAPSGFEESPLESFVSVARIAGSALLLIAGLVDPPTSPPPDRPDSPPSQTVAADRAGVPGEGGGRVEAEVEVDRLDVLDQPDRLRLCGRGGPQGR